VITPLMSALFPLYALSVNGGADWRTLVLASAFIYFADLAQDLIGGIHDEAGDRKHKVSTFAVVIGARRSLVVSLAAFCVAIAAGALLYFWAGLGVIYAVVFAALTAYILYRYYRLFRARGATLLEEAARTNHLAGGYFFLVSASIFVDFLVRSVWKPDFA
jgi:4-hydroxybenzoate polyprenyltransferase